jgi:hypothetical protein
MFATLDTDQDIWSIPISYNRIDPVSSRLKHSPYFRTHTPGATVGRITSDPFKFFKGNIAQIRNQLS